MEEINTLQIVKNDERRKLAQTRAVDLRLRMDNRAFVNKATKVKQVAKRDSKIKLLVKTNSERVELNRKLSKDYDANCKKADKVSNEFNKKLNKLQKEHDQKMNKFYKDFDKKQLPKRKLSERLSEKSTKLQEDLNAKYQECFITNQAEVRRIIAPFRKGSAGIVVKNLPCVKPKLSLMAEDLQNQIDTFIINTETLDDKNLSNAIDKFVK